MFNIDTEIKFMLSSLEDTVEKIPKKHELRCSSLPWCGLHAFVHDTERVDSFSSEFYTSIGTAVHESIQKWIAKNIEYRKDVFARWSCEKCNLDHGDCYHPGKCRNCAYPDLKYNELTLTYKSLSGHVDLVRRINDKNHCIVIDFKTTDLFKDLKRKGFSSWSKDFEFSKRYLIQIRTYCALLRKVKNLDIRGWSLVFIDRSNPPSSRNKPKVIYEKWTPSLDREYMTYINNLEGNWQDFKTLEKAITDNDKDTARDSLKSLIDNRPCQTPQDYSNWMEAKFYKEGCPSQKVCTRQRKKDIFSHLLSIVEASG